MNSSVLTKDEQETRNQRLKMFNFNIPIGFIADVDSIVALRGQSRSEFIREAIRLHIERAKSELKGPI